MSKLVWDLIGDRQYETGVDKVALFVQEAGAYPKGVAWSGVTAITESPSGAEPTPLYADNIKYLNLISAEELALSIEAYSSPEEFDACDGTASPVAGLNIGQQDRKTFGLVYRTIVGNDTEMNSHGYKLHLVYGCMAAPSEKAHNTVNDSPEATTLSWEVSTTPVNVTGYKPTSSLEINSTKVDKSKLTALEAILFGSDDVEARLPLPDEIITLLGGTVGEEG